MTTVRPCRLPRVAEVGEAEVEVEVEGFVRVMV
jgi:hypothetical protein